MNNGHHTVKTRGNTHPTAPILPLPYPTRTPTPEEAAEQLFTDGYAVFPGVLSRDEVALWKDRMDAMGDQSPGAYEQSWGYNKHLSMSFTRDPVHLELIDRPGLVDAAELALSGGDDGGVRVLGGTYWTTGAGRAMGIHLDWLPVAVPEAVHATPGFRMPIFIATAHFYLNDLTLEHGPTLLVPGSFRAGRAPQDEAGWNGIEPQAALVKAGDAVLFRGDLWHGAARNTHPTERRYMIQVHYAYGYIHPRGAYSTRETPSVLDEALWAPEVLAALNPRQRRLLGG